MNVREAFRIAMRGLRTHRLRSVLTTLGIMIGVAAVIVLVGLGNGLQTGFNETFGSLATQITVTPTTGGVPGGSTAKHLTDSDVDALRDRAKVPDVASATPIVTGTSLAQAGTGQARTSLTGTTVDYPDVTARDLVVGSYFDQSQYRGKAKVVVLGPDPVATLFGGDAGSAVGREVRIGRTSFKVIGVVKSDGQKDDVAIMPLSTARGYLVGGDTVNEIIVKANSAAAVPAVLDQVTRILSERHNIKDPAKRDFEAQALNDLLEKSNQSLTFLRLFTVAVAAISLIVGSIGVANIMLVSVTERTREIGIRKAIGATRSAILTQFLIESTVLAGMGGVIGILLGVGIILAGAAILPQAVPDFPPPEVSLSSIAIAFSISLAIGVIAGGYPANRAARLRPIEALRYQ